MDSLTLVSERQTTPVESCRIFSLRASPPLTEESVLTTFKARKVDLDQFIQFRLATECLLDPEEVDFFKLSTAKHCDIFVSIVRGKPGSKIRGSLRFSFNPVSSINPDYANRPNFFLIKEDAATCSARWLAYGEVLFLFSFPFFFSYLSLPF